MKNFNTLMCLLAMFLTVSCAESKKEDEQSNDKVEPVASEEVKVDTHEEIQDELHLHGENKWKVSEHMVEHIKSVDSLVNNYNVTSEKTPKALAIEVDEQLKMVTQTCDMTGEAHAQLHLWLLPFWNLVDQMKESTDPEKQMVILGEMKESIKLYHTYFE